jgi:hypothetical protein
MNAMDAVLPLTLRDAPRARILLRSLARHFEGLGTLWLVCPAAELSAIEREVAPASDGLNIVLLPESELLPELRYTPWLKGWYRQQLVKLAIHERVRSELYLTLDADVICVKRASPSAIAPLGLAPCHTVERDLHGDWYRSAQALLGLEAPRKRISHNVTPALLHRRAVAELAAYLEQRAHDGAFARGLRGISQRLVAAAAGTRCWRLLLAAGAPWTEYALYYTFLEATGRFERYHFHSDSSLYDDEGSFWRADARDFSRWSPTPALRSDGAPWFVVVQSNTGVSPAEVEAKLQGCVAHV